MSESSIKVGDVVHLKSGSPPLTVAALIASTQYKSVAVVWWWSKDDKRMTDEIPVECLSLGYPVREPPIILP